MNIMYKHERWTNHSCLFDLNLRANREYSQMKIDMEIVVFDDMAAFEL